MKEAGESKFQPDSELFGASAMVPKGFSAGRPDIEHPTLSFLPDTLQLKNKLADLSGNAGPPSETETETGILRFLPRKVVGQGGCGEIWEAEQTSLGRTIAIKRVRRDVFERFAAITGEPQYIENIFRQEGLVTASLEHPNIVPVYDLATDAEGRAVLAMKLVRGERWDRMIREDLKSMPMAEYLDRHLPILIGMAQATAFAHSRGIIHRDLKPSQVMVGEYGEVLLMDWGLALVFDPPRLEPFHSPDAHAGTMPSMDSATSPAGTPVYMAPEQAANTVEGLGYWTDVFLLGATLYHVLTGLAPYEGEQSVHVMLRVADAAFTVPHTRFPDREIPAELEAVCLRAMQTAPADRYASVQEFIEDVRGFLTGATKRRESRSLTDHVRNNLSEAGGDYRTLAEYESALVRAVGLWPENHEAEQLREELLKQYTQAALDNGDLVLARVQAQRMGASDHRDEILHEIGAMEKLVELAEEEAIEREMSVRSHQSKRRETTLILAESIELAVTLIYEKMSAPASTPEHWSDNVDRLEKLIEHASRHSEVSAMLIQLARGRMALSEARHRQGRKEQAAMLLQQARASLESSTITGEYKVTASMLAGECDKMEEST